VTLGVRVRGYMDVYEIQEIRKIGQGQPRRSGEKSARDVHDSLNALQTQKKEEEGKSRHEATGERRRPFTQWRNSQVP